MCFEAKTLKISVGTYNLLWRVNAINVYDIILDGILCILLYIIVNNSDGTET